jgi:hypothetical protein
MRLLLSIAAILAATLIAPAATSAQDDQPVPVILIDACTAEYAAKPSAWHGGCGACGAFFSHARWESWGGVQARGIARIRNAVPRDSNDNCASAYKRARTRRVRVVLSGRRMCGERTIYSVVTVRRLGRTVLVDRVSQRCFE